MKKLINLPLEERPREKLQQKGPKSLSDIELLAILLGKGTRDIDVLALAKKVLLAIDNNGGRPDLEKLNTIKGMGVTKACIISAALEFARRRIRPEGRKIAMPADILPIVRHYADRKQEHLLCTALNGAHEVITTRVVTIGLVNCAHIHPREVFADPLVDRSSAIILAHNHPSGNLTPSQEDIDVTKKIKDAGSLLGIKLLDHIIFNHQDYYSLKANNEL